MKQETKEEMFEQFFNEPELKALLKDYFMTKTRDNTLEDYSVWKALCRVKLRSCFSYIDLRVNDYRDKINFKESEDTSNETT